MITKEDYEIRLAVANQMRELARKISPMAVELADLGIAALDEQWQRATAELIKKEFLNDHRRLEWLIKYEVSVCKPHATILKPVPENGYYLLADFPHEIPDTLWPTARQAIDAGMLIKP